jgi:hypothetical protein
MAPGQHIGTDPEMIAAIDDSLVRAQAIEPPGIPLLEVFDSPQPRLVGGQRIEK